MPLYKIREICQKYQSFNQQHGTKVDFFMEIPGARSFMFRRSENMYVFRMAVCPLDQLEGACCLHLIGADRLALATVDIFHPSSTGEAEFLIPKMLTALLWLQWTFFTPPHQVRLNH
jgi:hypothetical protein